jgi:hypothetical protein
LDMSADGNREPSARGGPPLKGGVMSPWLVLILGTIVAVVLIVLIIRDAGGE